MIHVALAILVLQQCPDGAPPPCARTTQARSVAAPPDPHRIAVLPFRVTTADTLFGEGLAELLNNEFIGPSGPRPVLMGTVLRAWRRAGGGLRAALSQTEAARLATELGAGQYVDGSVVGVGPQLTISASVISVPGGEVRRAPRVSGPLDSLPALIERFAAGLLATAGTNRSGPSQRLSDSPDAIRAYFEGLASFRRARFDLAAVAFERAFTADEQFARAAFMRWLTATWGPGFGTPVQTLWRDRARTLRDRLSPSDQVLIDAAFGSLAERERAVAAMPESPELWYLIGDTYYHSARTRGWAETMALARTAFERSVALDSQATSLHHLVEIGLWNADTALLRAAWPAYDRLAPGNVGLGLVVAARLGDARLTESLRRRLPRSTGDSSSAFEALLFGAPMGLSAALLGEAYTATLAQTPPAARPGLRLLQFVGNATQGRPAAAARLADEGPTRDANFFDGFDPDVWLMVSAALGDGDRRLGEAARARVLAARHADSSALAVARCGTGLWDALVRDTVSGDDSLLTRHGQRSCAATLRILAMQRAGSLDSAALRALDTAAANGVLWPYSQVGRVVVTRAWERLGVLGRALLFARQGSVGFPDFSVAMRRRQEARLAAATGDTVSAIRVYHEYLEQRRDPEPVLIPQRDSVQAELNRLLGRGRPIP